MLPSASAQARSLVGVADDLLGALDGTPRGLPPARSVVLVVIDGVGALALRAHAGHARTLTAGSTKRDVALSVFPTTTAAALTTILTGVAPGEHGLVGYRIRDPRRDVLVNQLSGWEKEGVDPLTWQAAPTVFERAEGRPVFVVGTGKYRGSGFTRAVLRGAEYVAAETPADRVRRAYELAADHEGALVYCYLPEADQAGHKHGMDSDAWIGALEEIDGALRVPIPAGVGVLVTADHGMIDVPVHRQLLLGRDDPRWDGVRLLGGEPRMLHVYLEDGADPAGAAAVWTERCAGSADVGTREEAIALGLFGPTVTPEAAARIGDLLVVARGARAFYDAEDPTGRGMVGQHGALTPEERQVPYIRWGAFAS